MENSPSALPVYKIKSYGAHDVTIELDSLTFEGFMSDETKCGARQVALGLNPYSADYIPLHTFSSTKFIDVVDNAVAFIYDPPQKWANSDDCGAFPCTAPSNVVLSFENTRFSGIIMSQSSQTFQIVSNTPGASESFDNCDLKETWNAYKCSNSYLGVL